MTSLTTLVSMSVANAAVILPTNWDVGQIQNFGQNGLSIKISEAINQYRECVTLADGFQLDPNICSQQNGLDIVTGLANSILDSYDYYVSIPHAIFPENSPSRNSPFLKDNF